MITIIGVILIGLGILLLVEGTKSHWETVRDCMKSTVPYIFYEGRKHYGVLKAISSYNTQIDR